HPSVRLVVHHAGGKPESQSRYRKRVSPMATDAFLLERQLTIEACRVGRLGKLIGSFEATKIADENRQCASRRIARVDPNVLRHFSGKRPSILGDGRGMRAVCRPRDGRKTAAEGSSLDRQLKHHADAS